MNHSRRPRYIDLMSNAMLLPFLFLFGLCILDYSSTGVTAVGSICLALLFILLFFIKIKPRSFLDWPSILLLLLLSSSIASYFLYPCVSRAICHDADRALLLFSAPVFVYLGARAIALSSSTKAIFDTLLATAYISAAILMPIQLYQLFTVGFLDVLEPPLLVPIIGILEASRLGLFGRPLYVNSRTIGPFACISSALISGSRTCVFTLLISSLCYFFVLARSRKKFAITALIVVVTTASGFFLLSNVFIDFHSIQFGFLYKFLNSISEIFWTSGYDATYDELSLKWRGFESFVFFSYIQQSDLLAIFLGRGLSYALPLPFEMELAGNKFWELPLLHNGFQFVFLKLGFLGFSFVILFFALLIFGLSWRTLFSVQSLPSSWWFVALFCSSLLVCLVEIFIGGGCFQGASYSLLAVLGFSRFLLSERLK